MGACLHPQPTQPEKDLAKGLSLYDEIGGSESLEAFVDLFYKKLLSDDKLAPFFHHTSMNVQQHHLKMFLTAVFGGPQEYKGRSLYEAHSGARKMGLTSDIFDIVAGYLMETLSELGIKEHHINTIVDIALSVKDDVLGAKECYSSQEVNSSPESDNISKVDPTVITEIHNNTTSVHS
eukprot:331500_1